MCLSIKSDISIKELQLVRQLSPVYINYYLKQTPLINTLKPVGKPLPNLPETHKVKLKIPSDKPNLE